MEPEGDEAEEAKGYDLRGDTRQGDVLAALELGGRIRVRHLGAADDDGADQLQEEGEDVETDEDGREPPGWSLVSRDATSPLLFRPLC